MRANPSQDLSNLLQSAPITVSVIAQLLVVATTTDFALLSPPGGRFEHVRFPNSFRATVAQLGDTAAQSLRKSYSDFDLMQRRCVAVKPDVTEIIQLLSGLAPGQNPDSEPEVLQDIADLLPGLIEHLDGTVNKCLETARETHAVFASLNSLVEEISYSCVQTKGK